MHAEVCDKAGLDKTADFVNYLLALATGALVFSAGLIKPDYQMSSGARVLLLASWCLLAMSVLGGMFAYMRIPVMLSEQNYNLEDKYMIWPGRVQQGAFVFGIVALGAALFIVLLNRPLGAKTQAEGSQTVEGPRGHFTISRSAKVFGVKGQIHYHTFLLNDVTGDLWEMRCARNGAVKFYRISVQGFPSSRNGSSQPNPTEGAALGICRYSSG